METECMIFLIPNVCAHYDHPIWLNNNLFNKSQLHRDSKATIVNILIYTPYSCHRIASNCVVFQLNLRGQNIFFDFPTGNEQKVVYSCTLRCIASTSQLHHNSKSTTLLIHPSQHLATVRYCCGLSNPALLGNALPLSQRYTYYIFIFLNNAVHYNVMNNVMVSCFKLEAFISNFFVIAINQSIRIGADSAAMSHCCCVLRCSSSV